MSYCTLTFSTHIMFNLDSIRREWPTKQTMSWNFTTKEYPTQNTIHSRKSVTIQESNHALGVYTDHYAQCYVLKSSILLAGTGICSRFSSFIFTFPLRVFKWTFTFEMWFIPSWTNRFKQHPHTRHLNGLTSSPLNNVACLLTFAWRWTRIAMTLSAEL